MIKVIFEGSIFLHQKKGGISKYIQKINDRFTKHSIKSEIYAPIIISDILISKKKMLHVFLNLIRFLNFLLKFFIH